MKVFVVVDVDSGFIYGVYATIELARAAAMVTKSRSRVSIEPVIGL